MKPASALFLLGALLTLVACQGEDAVERDPEVLSTQLEALLERQGGPEALRLPESGDLEALPQDPNNPLTPARVELGKILFHDTRLGTQGKRPEGHKSYSCASCHNASAGFQAGIAQGIGEGGQGEGLHRLAADSYVSQEEMDVQPIRTPSALHGAWQPNQLWNGQFGATAANEGTEERWAPDTPLETNWMGYEGLETQAIAGLSVHRMGLDEELLQDPELIALFEAAFPEAPAGERMSLERAGLAIAAYERTLLANRAPFQLWLRGQRDAMDDASLRGALLFFGQANCAACHSGPALNSPGFYALGMGDLDGAGSYGDGPDDKTRLGRGGFTGQVQDEYCFKVPQLYNLTDARFLGHGATFRSVRAVIEYKNQAQPQNPQVPQAKLSQHFTPLGLDTQQIEDLSRFVAFALRDPELERYQP